MYVLLTVALAVLIVFGMVAYAVGRLDGGGEPEVGDRVGDGLPPGRLLATDVGRARFATAVRGYRMGEVDAVLDRLAGELAARDAELEELRGQLAGRQETEHG